MDEEWWARRAVLSGLAVVGVVTAVFTTVSVLSGAAPTDEVDLGGEAVTSFVPSEPKVSDGPLRLEEMLVAGRHGSPVDRPAHSLDSYEVAVGAGVDHLEVEVVVTSDDELVVLGDHELSLATDVAERPEFADRQVTKLVDGVETTGWFSEDFTREELLTLRLVEPEPELRPDNTSYDGELPVLAFDDLLTRVRELSDEAGREIGLFVEPRRAAYFRGAGKPIEPALAKALRRARLVNEPELVTVESPDLAVLRRLEDNLGDNVLSAYVVDGSSADRLQADALAGLPTTIDAIVVEVEAFAGECPYDLADRVHDADFALAVSPISYENARLGAGFREGDDPAGRGNLAAQMLGLDLIGADVVMAESPADVIEALAEVPDDVDRPAVAACDD